ncbi:MAG: CPBP family glutamic-type intramembrane protease [Planctomycetota bacterium]
MRWVAFLGPLVAFALVGYWGPRVVLGADASGISLSNHPQLALGVTVIRVVSMLLVVGCVMPFVRRVFPIRVSPVSVVVGAVGALIWIILCRLNIESSMLLMFGLPADQFGSRDAIDPWSLYPDASHRFAFLFFRFTLLVVTVPIAEELMLRGCLMRAIEADDWHALPLKQIGRVGLITATVYGIVSHPAEWIAAAAWFSLVTWMMVRTNRFWDCVVAHSVTNAILGAYIVASGDYRLW